MRTRLKSKEVKACELPNWDFTNVLELVFCQWDKEVRILIKDINEDTNQDSMVKQARKKAKVYFGNITSPLIR